MSVKEALKSYKELPDANFLQPVALEMNKTYSGGGTRNAATPDYTLIVGPVIERLVARAELGVRQHGRNNWIKSAKDPEFYIDAHNHLFAHAVKLLTGTDAADDHVGAILWACMAIAHMEQYHGALLTATEAVQDAK